MMFQRRRKLIQFNLMKSNEMHELATIILIGWGESHCLLSGDHRLCRHPWHHPRCLHQVHCHHHQDIF